MGNRWIREHNVNKELWNENTESPELWNRKVTALLFNLKWCERKMDSFHSKPLINIPGPCNNLFDALGALHVDVVTLRQICIK